ncbi:MAG: ornithine carbamoyltransferase [Actinomycetota bacterium]
MSPRHFLDIAGLTADEVRTILDLAQRPIPSLGKPLDGLGAALIFEKPSNRTRHSMEIAVMQLGGHPVYTRGEEVGIDVRETAEDIAAVMAGYHGVLAARVFKHDVVVRMAQVSTVPVVNMLSDHSHPLQALADALTMEQTIGDLAGRSVAWSGDWNNVARSLAEICVLLGAKFSVATPADYAPAPSEVARINALGSGEFVAGTDPVAAVTGADAVHTDVWVSMGQEAETAEKEKAFAAYKVTTSLMAHAAPQAQFFHCLPTHRGYEVDADVIDGPASRVIQQAHNRLHSARGALAFIMGVK